MDKVEKKLLEIIKDLEKNLLKLQIENTLLLNENSELHREIEQYEEM
jgi:hypothetical protein